LVDEEEENKNGKEEKSNKKLIILDVSFDFDDFKVNLELLESFFEDENVNVRAEIKLGDDFKFPVLV
jgi:hypothetical protein